MEDQGGEEVSVVVYEPCLNRTLDSLPKMLRGACKSRSRQCYKLRSGMRKWYRNGSTTFVKSL